MSWAVIGLLLGGCAPAADDSGKLQVVAGLYPLAYIAERVGGPAVEVVDLTPAGAEAHDIELTAQQVATVLAADVVLAVPNLQPALDAALTQADPASRLDALAAIGRPDESDPHLWLNPSLLLQVAASLRDRLVELDPERATQFQQGYDSLASDITALLSEYETGLQTCDSRVIVVNHEAYGYLAELNGLEQIAVSGLSPESEPSPARLREVADLVRQLGVTTIYSESALDTKVAATISSETGAKLAVLTPIESRGLDATADYLDLMRENLAALVKGQGCR